MRISARLFLSLLAAQSSVPLFAQGNASGTATTVVIDGADSQAMYHMLKVKETQSVNRINGTLSFTKTLKLNGLLPNSYAEIRCVATSVGGQYDYTCTINSQEAAVSGEPTLQERK